MTEVFYSLLISSISALSLACLAGCYRSKCSHIKCCGIDIERDVKGEEQLDSNQNNNIKV
jgi:hypothetical protein